MLDKCKIKILVCGHNNFKILKLDSSYQYIIAGSINLDNESREKYKKLGFCFDDTLDNIGNLNYSFCEITALYRAYKNLNADIYGLMHYRRFLVTFSPYPHILKNNDIQRMLRKYDILLNKRKKFKCTLKEQLLAGVSEENIQKFIIAVKRCYPDYSQDLDEVLNSKKLAAYNIFITNKTIFLNYCDFLFKILFELNSIIDASKLDGYQKRIFGFFAERLLYVYVVHNRLNVKYLYKINIYAINAL